MSAQRFSDEIKSVEVHPSACEFCGRSDCGEEGHEKSAELLRWLFAWVRDDWRSALAVMLKLSDESMTQRKIAALMGVSIERVNSYLRRVDDRLPTMRTALGLMPRPEALPTPRQGTSTTPTLRQVK